MELATTPTHDLAIPTRAELEALTPADLWKLEDFGTALAEAARPLIDEQLRQWVEVEGKTVREVAEIVGQGKSTVSRRCIRLGISSGDARGGDRTLSQAGQNEPASPLPSPPAPDNTTEVEDEPEEVDGEIVHEPSRRDQADLERMSVLVGTIGAIGDREQRHRDMVTNALRCATKQSVELWLRDLKAGQRVLRIIIKQLEEES